MDFMLFKGKQREDGDKFLELILPVSSVVSIYCRDDVGSFILFNDANGRLERIEDDRSPSELFELLK